VSAFILHILRYDILQADSICITSELSTN